MVLFYSISEYLQPLGPILGVDEDGLVGRGHHEGLDLVVFVVDVAEELLEVLALTAVLLNISLSFF